MTLKCLEAASESDHQIKFLKFCKEQAYWSAFDCSSEPDIKDITLDVFSAESLHMDCVLAYL